MDLKGEPNAQELRMKQLWDHLPDFLKDPNNVPRLPIPLTDYHNDKLIIAGAIPKTDLVDQQWYIGKFRNTNIALWDKQNDEFKYRRNKFGKYFWDQCKHFQDDDGYALFVPVREATDIEIKTNLNDI